jgi:hypothetical protein
MDEDFMRTGENAIFELLEKTKCDKIIFIDDLFDVSEKKEEFIGLLDSLYNEKPSEISFVTWGKSRPAFKKRIAKTWDDATNSERLDLLKQIYTFNASEDQLNNIVPVEKLGLILEGKILTFSPNQWLDEFEDFWKKYSESDVFFLFLIDQEFNVTHGPASGKSGIDILKLIVESKHKDRVYCSIFTHDIKSIDEETAKWEEWSKNNHIEKKTFYPITKKRFDNGEDNYVCHLADGIKNALLVREVEELKFKSIQILESSQKRTIDDINGITPDTFNRIVQKSSYNEGVWEFETLNRINAVLSHHNIYNEIANEAHREIFNSCITRIREIDEINSGV